MKQTTQQLINKAIKQPAPIPDIPTKECFDAFRNKEDKGINNPITAFNELQNTHSTRSLKEELQFLNSTKNTYPSSFKTYLDNLNIDTIDLPTHTDNKKNNPLHISAENNYTNLIDYLLDKGCLIANSDGLYPIHLAAQKGHLNDCFTKLVNMNGRSYHNKEDNNGLTSLDHAAINGRTNIIDYLISTYQGKKEEEKPIYHRDGNGKTFLHHAIEHNQIGVVKHCIKKLETEKGAIDKLLEMKDNNKQTLLHYAIINGNHELIKLLITHGSPLNYQDNKRRTPLHLAVEQELPDTWVVNNLLNYEINYKLPNSDNKTAVQVAEEKKHTAIANILRSHEEEQNKKRPNAPIKNFVFQGSGPKFLAYSGAITEMENDEQCPIKLRDIQRVGGSSGGAILGLLIGLGYSAQEIENKCREIEFKSFLNPEKNQATIDGIAKYIPGIEKGLIKETIENIVKDTAFHPIRALKTLVQTPKVLYNLVRHGGVFSGDSFLDWVKNIIRDKTYDSDITFEELAKMTGKNFKHLYFTGVNTETGCSEVFSHETTPNMSIAQAVRISMSIPFAFQPRGIVEKHHGQSTKVGNDVYVDGGLYDNYPIWLFDYPQYNNGEKGHNPETLGFRLESPEQKKEREHKKAQKQKQNNNCENILDQSTNSKKTNKHKFNILHAIKLTPVVKNTFVDAIPGFKKQDSDFEHSNNDDRTVFIDNCGIATTESNLGASEGTNLVNSGVVAFREYFKIAKASLLNIPSLSTEQINILLRYCDKDFSIGCRNFMGTINLNKLAIANCPELIFDIYNAKSGAENIIAVLKRQKIYDLSITSPLSGDTALHLAMRGGHTNVAKKLLEADIDSNVQNKQNKTALDEAIEQELSNEFIWDLVTKYNVHSASQDNLDKVHEILAQTLNSTVNEQERQTKKRQLDGLYGHLKPHKSDIEALTNSMGNLFHKELKLSGPGQKKSSTNAPQQTSNEYATSIRNAENQENLLPIIMSAQRNATPPPPADAANQLDIGSDSILNPYHP
jgi:NTE family protein